MMDRDAERALQPKWRFVRGTILDNLGRFGGSSQPSVHWCSRLDLGQTETWGEPMEMATTSERIDRSALGLTDSDSATLASLAISSDAQVARLAH